MILPAAPMIASRYPGFGGFAEACGPLRPEKAAGRKKHTAQPPSSLRRGAGRAWGPACTLILLFFCLAGTSQAVPPGTVIDNSARAVYRALGVEATRTSNTATLVTAWPRTPGQIELLQYAPTVNGAQQVAVPTGSFDLDGAAGGATQQIAAVYTAGDSTPIDLSGPLPLISSGLYHQGEPIFLRVTDPDQNLDPALAEQVWVLATVAQTADSELLLLTESGPDSGVFLGYLQSGNTGTVQPYNGLLDVDAGARVTVRYTDIADGSDTVTMSALVDPYGLVFDSRSGQPVNNVQITLINNLTGQPATVFGDDGASIFPAAITSGGTFTDGSGKVYAFGDGDYRFPFVAPGSYRLQVTPPAGYAAPSTVSTADLQSLPGAPFAIAEPGSRGEAFVLNPGPAIRIDIPVDPGSLGLWVSKSANRETAAVGDFIQYTLGLENISTAAAPGVRVRDRLPRGFAYRSGSARLDGEPLADPVISSDGRLLTFTLGDLDDGTVAQIRYVTEVAAAARPGKAENRAQAYSTSGLASNEAVAAVTIKEDLFRSNTFIVGRVMADNCGDVPTDRADGVAGVRIYLEDGTYAVTDDQGRYHFEAVASGAHVVQLDLATIPEPYGIADCQDNSRSAGTPFSRFVDLQGGTLWRADFHVKSEPLPTGRASLQLSCGLDEKTVHYQARIDTDTVPLDNLRLTVVLPDGTEYVPGSSRLADQPLADPGILGNTLTFRLGGSPPQAQRLLGFTVRLNGAARPGRLHTQSLLTFNTPSQKNVRTPLVDTVLALRQTVTRQVQPTLEVRPRFGLLSADLDNYDQKLLDQIIEKLQGLEIEHMVLTGHTDNLAVRPGRNPAFPNNMALSLGRARAVADYLVPRLNLAPSQVTVTGMGADQPLASNDNEAGRALNRRVEVRVISVRLHLEHDVETIRCEDQVMVATQGRHAVEKPAGPEETETPSAEKAFDVDRLDLDKLPPGFAILEPAPADRPPIPSIKLAVQHGIGEGVELLVNGQPVSPLNFEGRRQNRAGSVAVSFWRGVDLQPGDNLITVLREDSSGQVLERISRVVHYSDVPVEVQLVQEASKLVADGREKPVIAVRLLDRDHQPARFGIVGDYEVLPPYQPFTREEETSKAVLTRLQEEKPRYHVDRQGIARLYLQPTTRSGWAVARLPLSNKVHEIRVWLAPETREWILVGLAEGSLGYNTASGNMENLAAADQEEDFYKDGRLAFFAKGKLKGSWLLTAAFDSKRDHRDPNRRLFQEIDPDTYYTLYGDATRQRHEAPSIRKLYLKIEREKFYALFGDFDTGLDVTELSKYSRRFNGLKTEYNGQRVSLNAFATETHQAFVKDEIRGDGTSGLYRLSRRDLVLNSEKIVLETRDRLRSEVIVSSQTLTRHIDYNIDYDAGTLFFKAPVYGRDEHFNPVYIVAEYEADDLRDEAYTYGGRGAVKLADEQVRVGATYVHEGPRNAETDLNGVDLQVDLGAGVELKAEAARTQRRTGGQGREGTAYLAEITRQGRNLDARAYFREQGEDFGLGQQNGSEDQTRKIGTDLALRLNRRWQAAGELYRQSNLASEAERDLGELQLNYNGGIYQLNTGVRRVEDRFADGSRNQSTQLIAGAARQFLDNRLKLRASREQSIDGGDGSVDFPTRTLFGADYQATRSAAVFAEHEIAQNGQQDTHSSRAGVKATPWQGGQVGSSMGRSFDENGERLFADLGLNQTWQLNDQWRLDGGFDRTQTLNPSDRAPFNANVPNATGAQEDFTAVSAGAGYKVDLWSWTGRVETRLARSQDKYGLISGAAGEVRPGLGLSAGVQYFRIDHRSGAGETDADLRLSLALRPRNSRWIVFDRLDYKLEDRSDSNGREASRRIINNLNLNFKASDRLQVALQYGAKYVLETFNGDAYSGYTDLAGLEARYDLTPKWDLGLHASVLRTWAAGQTDYRSGVSMGYALFPNTWVSLGYNFTGFTDEDFSAAGDTAQGPFVRFRIKFDQQSVREMISWFKK